MSVSCPRCELYEYTRGPRIKGEIAKTSEGEEADRRWRRFMFAYHRRHGQVASEFTAGRFVALMARVRDLQGDDLKDQLEVFEAPD